MRYIFALFVLIFGFMVLVTDAAGNLVEQSDETLPVIVRAVVEREEPSPSARISTVVDRNDDPPRVSERKFPCTEAPNDCPLRRAIQIANQDKKATVITFADHYVIRLTRPLDKLTEDRTSVRAAAGQQVYIDGAGTDGSVFHITGAHVTIDGLHIYGAGPGHANISIHSPAHSAQIANNVIGDDDAPQGDCGLSPHAYGGIYVATQAKENDGAPVNAWIYGNIVECHQGSPGDGIRIVGDNVMVGQNAEGDAGREQQNTVRLNGGCGLCLASGTGNTIRNNLLHDNNGDELSVANFNNDILENVVR